MPNFDIDEISIKVNSQAGNAAKQIERLSKAFDTLGNNPNASKSSERLKDFEAQAKLYESSSYQFASGLLRKGAGLYIYSKIGKAIGRTVMDGFNESINFTENRNLFYVTMGKYASAAEEYAETVSDVLGTNVSEWLRFQGVINDMTKSFGMAESQAYSMSKTLTQLVYDYSSFYNMSVQEAYEKINSGIAGEIEPMRRLGKDISIAKLESVALAHGITRSVDSMTQAEKAQLRFIAIMEQSTDVMGDMARTIDDPANALRVLDSRWTAFTRSLGNLFIPIVKNTLPYLQAGVIILKDWADSIASFFGIKPETVDFESTASNLAAASESVSDIKRNLLGIDEINKLGNTSDSGTSVGGDLGLDLSQWDYDFLGDANQRANELAESLKPVATALGLVGAAFVATKLVTGGANLIKSFKLLGDGAKTLTRSLGTGMLVGGLLATSVAAIDMAENGQTLGNTLGSLVGVGMGALGGAMIGGPVGAVIGGLATLVSGMWSYEAAVARIKKEAKLAEFFKVEGQAFSGVEAYFNSFLSTLQSDKMADALETVAKANTEFETARSNVNGVITSLLGDRDNLSLVEDLADAFEALGKAAKDLNAANIGTAFQSIANSLTGEFSSIVSKMERLPEILAKLEGESDVNLGELKKQYEDIIAEAKVYGWTDELTKEANEVWLAYHKYTGKETNSVLSSFQTNAAVIGDKINAGSSAEEVKDNVSKLKASFSEFEKQLTDEMSQVTTVFDSLINQALNNSDTDSAKMLSQYRTVLLAEYNNRLFAGQEEYNKILDKISDSYLGNVGGTLDVLKNYYLETLGEEYLENQAYPIFKSLADGNFRYDYSYGKFSAEDIKKLTDSFTNSEWLDIFNFNGYHGYVGEVDALEDLLISNLDNVINQKEDSYSKVTEESITSVNTAIAEMSKTELDSLEQIKTITGLLEQIEKHVKPEEDPPPTSNWREFYDPIVGGGGSRVTVVSR